MHFSHTVGNIRPDRIVSEQRESSAESKTASSGIPTIFQHLSSAAIQRIEETNKHSPEVFPVFGSVADKRGGVGVASHLTTGAASTTVGGNATHAKRNSFGDSIFSIFRRKGQENSPSSSLTSPSVVNPDSSKQNTVNQEKEKGSVNRSSNNRNEISHENTVEQNEGKRITAHDENCANKPQGDTAAKKVEDHSEDGDGEYEDILSHLKGLVSPDLGK